MSGGVGCGSEVFKELPWLCSIWYSGGTIWKIYTQRKHVWQKMFSIHCRMDRNSCMYYTYSVTTCTYDKNVEINFHLFRLRRHPSDLNKQTITTTSAASTQAVTHETQRNVIHAIVCVKWLHSHISACFFTTWDSAIRRESGNDDGGHNAICDNEIPLIKSLPFVNCLERGWGGRVP